MKKVKFSSHTGSLVLYRIWKQYPESVPRCFCGQVLPARGVEAEVTPVFWAVLSHLRLSATPWTVAHPAPLSWDSSGKNPGVGSLPLLQLGCATRRRLCQLPCVGGGCQQHPAQALVLPQRVTCTDSPHSPGCRVLLVRKFRKLMVSSQKKGGIPKMFPESSTCYSNSNVFYSIHISWILSTPLPFKQNINSAFKRNLEICPMSPTHEIKQKHN